MTVIVAAAIVRAGRLLSARRSGGPLAGLWEFPGGKVEPGEGDREALARELREELAVDAVIGRRIGGDWPLADGRAMHVYLATLPAGLEPACVDSHDALAWLSAEELDSVSWIPADLAIVDVLRGHLADRSHRDGS